MLRKSLAAIIGIIAVIAFSAIPAQARALNLTNVNVVNVQTGNLVVGHGHGQKLTDGGSGNSHWSQVNCLTNTTICEWQDTNNHLCWDSGVQGQNGNLGVTSEESCQFGNTSEEYNTSTGPNGPNNPGYWFWNEYWNGVDLCNGCAFLTLDNGQIDANIAAGSGNYAVWHVGS